MYADVERHRLPLFIRLLQDILFYENSCIFYYIRLSKGGSHLSNAFNRKLMCDHIKSCVVNDIRAGDDTVVDELCETMQKLMK